LLLLAGWNGANVLYGSSQTRAEPKQATAKFKLGHGGSNPASTRTFAMNVSQIYDGDGDPVETKIELEKSEAAN
jgi:hypothetical protein